MAKKSSKETSLPLVISLVFFVLTTIAFGVMWYMQFSEQAQRDEAVKSIQKEKSAASGISADKELEARVLRVLMGIPEEKDNELLASESAKNKEKINTLVKKYDDAIAKATGSEDASKLADEYKVWPMDANGVAAAPPEKGFIPLLGDAIRKRNAANDDSKAKTAIYQKAVETIQASIKTMDDMKKKLDEVSAALPVKFKKDFEDVTKKFEDRTKEFRDKEAASRSEWQKTDDDRQRAEALLDRKVKESQGLKKELSDQAKMLAKKRDTFQYDEPQGKILRRLGDGVVEINIGSDALVRPGLTFTVLPGDFPETGRQSRMRTFRIPDDKGDYQNVVRFVEKGTIEVIEVNGPKLSRCRISSENDKINDGVGPGDLLYNAVWRKGSTDHIALIGVFDLNGDGSDDIEGIIRDLKKMGIPVDAYFDLKNRRWVGQVDVQTRYIVRGESPIILSANDPKKEEKSKLYTAINSAVEAAQLKGGAQAVSYRDFFPRMGLRVNPSSSPERINQAVAPYLQNVTAVVETPMTP